jgi:hypothetical protein
MMIETPFSHAFEFELVSELRSNHTKRLFYPGAIESGGHDGLNVHVIPHESDEWIGTFAFGHFGPKAITGICTTPSPTKLCVIAEGQAYLVDVVNPEACDSLRIIPVLAVRSSAKHRLLIFASHTELLAVGVDGIAWRKARLSWDSMKLTSMNDDKLCGVFWDIRSESEQGFTVDLATGRHTGGASIPV